MFQLIEFLISLGTSIRPFKTYKLIVRAGWVRPKMSNPISQLNELGPTVQVHYAYGSYSIDGVEGHRCRITVIKDRETLDCDGVALKKHDAKLRAAHQMVALLKLLFPIVPLALFNQPPSLNTAYIRVETLYSKHRYIVCHLPEIRSINIHLYINRESKTYFVLTNPPPLSSIWAPECPVELFNDPIRFTDWSQGPVTPAQEAYLSKRIELALP